MNPVYVTEEITLYTDDNGNNCSTSTHFYDESEYLDMLRMDSRVSEEIELSMVASRRGSDHDRLRVKRRERRKHDKRALLTTEAYFRLYP